MPDGYSLIKHSQCVPVKTYHTLIEHSKYHYFECKDKMCVCDYTEILIAALYNAGYNNAQA